MDIQRDCSRLFSSDLYRSLLESSQKIVLRMRPDGRILYINPFALEFFGYDERTIVGQSIYETLLPTGSQGDPLYDDLIGRMASDPAAYLHHVNQNRRRDGSLVWVAWTNLPVFDSHGQVQEILSTGTEITELVEAQNRYQVICEHTGQAMALVDASTTILMVNRRFETLTGYRKEEIEGRRSWTEFVVPEDRDRMLDYARRRLADDPNVPPQYQFRLKTRSGQWRHILINLSRIPGTDQTICALLDITDRVQIEQDLELQKAYFEAIYQNSPDAVALLDPQDHIVSINKTFTRLFQYEPHEAVGRPINDLVTDDSIKAHAEDLSRQALQGIPFEVEAKRKRKDGTSVEVAIVASPIRLEGRLVGIYAAYRDIRRRKEAERALREMDAKYRSIVDHSNDAIFVLQDGFFRFWNPRFRLWAGYTDEEISQLPAERFVHPEDRSFVFEYHRRRLAGEPHVPSSYRFRALTKDGSVLWIHINAIVVDWDGRPATINFARDFTREKELESQLMQAQKMEAVGTLAGGIAHDFNNLLQSIQGYTELMLLNKDPDHPDRRRIQRILEGVQRGSELARQILTFSRKLESNPKPLNLNEEILKLKPLLDRTIPKMFEIRLDLDPQAPTIQADAPQIAQMVMNLVVNAKDVMPEGGRLIIATQAVLETSQLPPSLKPGKYVQLSVEDTGPGIPLEVQDKIFEPFFTTKPVGRGTGLGLAMVYGIVQNHGGTIFCDSEPGRGARFRIYFPATSETPQEVGSRDEPKPAARRTGTVLLVDDEEPTREIGSEMLEHCGHKVFTAGNGEEALELYRQQGHQIDVVILDWIMPGMGGQKCMEKLLALDPDARIIIASGFSPTEGPPELVRAQAFDFIAKPYPIQQLLDIIDRALDRPVSGP
ncbi:PAS domain S-box-containing protein [Desulfacinum hydrothermale DSM 13146]|uniref:histidine kinase n=1 Tax=Desulfacinum hydrothermale DSM 13146 TaxID=1121390 RepID=A0A1W1XGV4_9BACT|nr:PAS domain S-box protein [Desulfacinum hydrothermale]SMC23057.1 PAS domain S-box-containing protein [Desulfacinum hydrothermale DSM 13146]